MVVVNVRLGALEAWQEADGLDVEVRSARDLVALVPMPQGVDVFASVGGLRATASAEGGLDLLARWSVGIQLIACEASARLSDQRIR